jgi:hypothetical protein
MNQHCLMMFDGHHARCVALNEAARSDVGEVPATATSRIGARETEAGTTEMTFFWWLMSRHDIWEIHADSMYILVPIFKPAKWDATYQNFAYW